VEIYCYKTINDSKNTVHPHPHWKRRLAEMACVVARSFHSTTEALLGARQSVCLSLMMRFAAPTSNHQRQGRLLFSSSSLATDTTQVEQQQAEKFPSRFDMTPEQKRRFEIAVRCSSI